MLSARLLAAPVLVAFLVACGASQGEPCQEQDDCASDLMCCNSSTLGSRGTCEPLCTTRPRPDAGRDTGVSDAQTDAPSDAGSDAGTDAAADAGMDAGTPDTGVDSGADAGPADAAIAG